MIGDMVVLSERLKTERRKAGLTQEELAKRAGVGVATIARLEGQEIDEPRVSTLRKLADALEIQVKDLFVAVPILEAADVLSNLG
jgi:transcriptional regulator with XRE-family HTH domain